MLDSVPGRRLPDERGLVSALGFQPLFGTITPKAEVGPEGHPECGCSVGKGSIDEEAWELVSRDEMFAGVQVQRGTGLWQQLPLHKHLFVYVCLPYLLINFMRSGPVILLTRGPHCAQHWQVK